MALQNTFEANAGKHLRMAVMAFMIAATPMAAMAQQGNHLALAPSATNNATMQYEVKQQPMTRREAGFKSEGQVVLHYGKGIELPDWEAQVITNGLREAQLSINTAIAIPGGKDGWVELLIDKKIVASCTQEQLSKGYVGADARQYIETRLAPNTTAASDSNNLAARLNR